jgi:predicted transcriptional regulator
VLETIITSKTRIRLLLKFFLNPRTSGYLRSLASEFGESTNSIRQELNRFEKAGLLEAHSESNKKIFKANIKHPMFLDIQRIIHKFVGIDQILDKIISRLGSIKKVYIIGDFAKGLDSKCIEILIVAEQINESYLEELKIKTEVIINKKISYKIVNEMQMEDYRKTHKSENRLVVYGALW